MSNAPCNRDRGRTSAGINRDANDASLEARWGARISPRSDGCWLWTGYVNDQGYGSVSSSAGRFRAHRWVYETLVGPIPEGMVLHHHCQVRACVNPAHLEPMEPGDHSSHHAALNHPTH